MNRRFIVAAALLGVLGFSISANSADTPEAASVDGICGKVVAADGQGLKPFDHARVRLYPPTSGSDCCALITPVAEVTTSRDGGFQFKKQTPGDYWLVATLGGADYKLLIRYEPVKKVSADCAKALYVLEKGKFQLRRTEGVTAH